MIILGIDPGTTAIGYALLEAGNTPRLVHASLIPVQSTDTCERLCEIHKGLGAIIKKWGPEMASVEKLFFAANTKTAISVAEARGVILLTARLAGVSVIEYAPREIKKALTGDGRADKLQIKKMVGITIPDAANLRVSDDVFDAIAAALTCYFQQKLHLKRSREM